MNKRKLNRWGIGAAVIFFLGTLFPYAYGAAERSLKQLRSLIDVLEFVKENYVEKMDTDVLVSGAIKGVVNELDDFSQYLDAQDYKDLKNETKGEFGGLGIRLQKVDDFVTVMSPIPGTPAFKANIMPEDRILAVDDKDITAMKLDEAVTLMRGAVGSKVKLSISRKNKDGEYEPIPDITLKRATIVPEVVHFRMLQDGVGYIDLVDFSGHSTEAVRKAMDALLAQGMQKLVLDLRFNPGGLLTGAVDLSKLFLPAGKMIVYTKGRKPEYYQEFKTAAAPLYGDIPMAVLVNQGSASASEIVSGALQDNGRAVILGQRTFGKASVQQVIPLSGGAGLRLTIAKYYTPSGKLIPRDYRDKSKAEEGGIFPDVEVVVPLAEEGKIFAQYNKVVYTPGKEMPELKLTEKDPVLDRALEILTGKITLEEAKAQSEKEAAERKAKEAEKKKKKQDAKQDAESEDEEADGETDEEDLPEEE